MEMEESLKTKVTAIRHFPSKSRKKRKTIVLPGVDDHERSYAYFVVALITPVTDGEGQKRPVIVNYLDSGRIKFKEEVVRWYFENTTSLAEWSYDYREIKKSVLDNNKELRARVK
jgi:hypothetical protein